jgi:hypothetical protein
MLVEQSGLQATYGGYTENPILQNVQFEQQRQSAEVKSLKERPMDRSMWMVLYALLVAGGVLAGLLVWRTPLRSGLLIGCSASAGLVLLMQARSGFPLEHAFPSTVTKQVSIGPTIEMQVSSPTLLQTRYTVWFWLTVVAVCASLVASCAEFWILRKPARSRT